MPVPFLEIAVIVPRCAITISRRAPSASDASITDKEYVERWLEDRRPLSLASWGDDANRLRKHGVPLIGKLELSAVRPSDVRDVALYHRKANKLDRGGIASGARSAVCLSAGDAGRVASSS